MQAHIDQNAPAMKPNLTIWYLSIFLWVMILGLSSYFAIASWMREWDISTANSEIASLEKDIATISADRNILIANIIKNNTLRPSLDLGPLLTEFRSAAARANVKLFGFSIVDDVITTTLTATEGDSWVHPDPAATIIKMMREYATNKMTFSLDPISSLSWDPTARTTSIRFRVLPSHK